MTITEPETVYQVTFHCDCEHGEDAIAFTDAAGVAGMRAEQQTCQTCWQTLMIISARLATEDESIKAQASPTWNRAQA